MWIQKKDIAEGWLLMLIVLSDIDVLNVLDYIDVVNVLNVGVNCCCQYPYLYFRDMVSSD